MQHIILLSPINTYIEVQPSQVVAHIMGGFNIPSTIGNAGGIEC